MIPFPISEDSPVEHGGPLPASADCVIIGGGVIGICTALYLAKAGLRPVVLEKGRVAGEQSSRNWGWVPAWLKRLDIKHPVQRGEDKRARHQSGQIGIDNDQKAPLEFILIRINISGGSGGTHAGVKKETLHQRTSPSAEA